MSKQKLTMKYHPAKKEVEFHRFQNGKEVAIRSDSRLTHYMNLKGKFVLQDFQEVSVKNRKYADITLNAASPTPTVLSFLKLQMSLEPYLNRLQVMAYARYAFSTSSGTFTLDFGLTSETFYVYRIEGIK